MRAVAFAALAAFAALPAPAGVGPDAPGVVVAEAGARIGAARVRLEAAGEGAARQAALAESIRAYEAALAALRDGVHGAGDAARAIVRELAGRDAEIRQLIAALAIVARQPRAEPGLHPGGPIAAARAAALVAPINPALEGEAAALRRRLAELAEARRLQRAGEAEIAEGLALLGDARAELGAALGLRPGEIVPLAPDDALATMMRGSDTLGEFAAALDGVRVTKSARNAPGAEAEAVGPPLAMPVAGWVLRGFGAADAAGVRRPGVMLAAPPRALVTAPVAARVRYAGPFLDYGYVAILEPAPGALVILAGLGELYVRGGAAVVAGAPVGLLGGRDLDAQEFLMLPGHGNEALGAETLYIEVWADQQPVDPGPLLVGQNG